MALCLLIAIDAAIAIAIDRSDMVPAELWMVIATIVLASALFVADARRKIAKHPPHLDAS